MANAANSSASGITEDVFETEQLLDDFLKKHERDEAIHRLRHALNENGNRLITAGE